jgi:hypothetical protein
MTARLNAARVEHRPTLRVNQRERDSQGLPMVSELETVALFCLKLAYQTEDQSPILRDDLIMGDYQRDIFELLIARGDVDAIQQKINECLRMALDAMGGPDTPLGRELQRVSAGFNTAQTLDLLDTPLGLIKGYLREVV